MQEEIIYHSLKVGDRIKTIRSCYVVNPDILHTQSGRLGEVVFADREYVKWNIYGCECKEDYCNGANGESIMRNIELVNHISIPLKNRFENLEID